MGRLIRFSRECASRLHVEHWLMILAVTLLLSSFRFPTGPNIAYETPEMDFVSCDSPRNRCPVNFESSTMLVKRVVDDDYLQSLEKRISQHHFDRHGFSMVHDHGCKSAFRTSIIVPYRNRTEHLKIFLQHMHKFLSRQQIDYAIYVVEQVDSLGFNRGKLFNVGFKEASKDHPYCCYIFHDVDLLPENLGNLYVCGNQPRHMCVSLDTFRYVVPYADLFGGVIALQREHFEKVNGFSNRYFGWGAEDDDMAIRIRESGLEITRWPPTISRYTMLSHKNAEPNKDRFKLLEQADSLWKKDGLNSLDNYVVETVQRNALYTKISVRFESLED